MNPSVSPMAPSAIPLALIGPGQPVRLAGVDGGRGLQGRLIAMGLTPGVECEVLSGGGSGPLVLAVGQARLVLGRGMAHRIRVVTR